MDTRYALMLMLIILLCGCGETTRNPVLERLDKMAKVNSRVELDSLYSISKDELSKEDKVYYDFLSVKLADKAIIHHTSDSIILPSLIIIQVMDHRSVMRKHYIMEEGYIMT